MILRIPLPCRSRRPNRRRWNGLAPHIAGPISKWRRQSIARRIAVKAPRDWSASCFRATATPQNPSQIPMPFHAFTNLSFASRTVIPTLLLATEQFPTCRHDSRCLGILDGPMVNRTLPTCHNTLRILCEAFQIEFEGRDYPVFRCSRLCRAISCWESIKASQRSALQPLS